MKTATVTCNETDFTATLPRRYAFDLIYKLETMARKRRSGKTYSIVINKD
jgi:hypothetical protein